MKTKILQKDAGVLRQIAREVSPKDIRSKKIANLLKKMQEALYAEDDGVAIAAPQIGESLCIFMVSRKITGAKDLVFINPQIIKASKTKKKMEEGCLSIRWLYGDVKRSDKVTVRAYDETGKLFTRGASGLLAQIFQHETDHLNGILFTDKAENLRDLPPEKKPSFVFFGSSQFSTYVLEELESHGLSPILNITSAKDPLPMEKLKELEADIFVVASFGKILPKELIEIPKYKTLNVHPSLLPELRGSSPIQNTILDKGKPGVTIIRMDEKMDHGPILAQAKVTITPWPDHYAKVEEKLARAGGKVLASILPRWINGEIEEISQDDNKATYTKLINKEDGRLDLSAPADDNLRKVLAYSRWPGAYMMYRNKRGTEVRVVVKDAKIVDGKFLPARIIPAGRKEMGWQDFLRGN